MDATAPDALDRLEGRIVLGEELGRGGFGVVRAALDRATGARLAVKIAHSRSLGAELPRLQREIALLARLDHPSLARLQGILQDASGNLALVYDFVPGQDLTRVVPEGPPPRPQALAWLGQLARGVDHLHGHGVLHRDIKPENVRIRPDDSACLLDFGLARSLDRGNTLTATGMILGTPHFMAPEALRGEPLDARADLFSLAALSYWLLTGRVPFPGPSPVAILRAQGAPLPPSPDLEGSLHQALARALAPEPELRPGSAGEFLAGLEAAISPSGKVPEAEATRVLVPAEPAGRSEATEVLSREAPAPEAEERSAPPGPAGSPPRGGSHLPRALGALSLVLLVLGGLAWSRDSAPPEAPLPPPAPLPEGPSSPFPADLARRIRDQLTESLTRFVDQEGRLLPREAEQGARPLVEGAPEDWGTLLGSLPDLARFMEWVSEGGRADQLPENFLADLEETDAYFFDSDLPRPLYPYLVGPPPGEIQVPGPAAELVRGVTQLPVPEVARGWEAAYWLALGRCLEGLDRRQTELAGDRRELPPILRPAHSLTGDFLADTVEKVLRSCFALEAVRTASARWVVREAEEFQACLHALGRCAREGSENLALLTLATERLVDHPMTGMLRTHLVSLPLPWLLGRSEGYPPWFGTLESTLWIARERAWFAVRAEHPRVAACRQRARSILERGLDQPPPGFPPALRLWMRRFVDEIGFRLMDQDLEGVVSLYRRLVEQVPLETLTHQYAWPTVQARLGVALLLSDSTLGVPRPLLEGMLATFRSHHPQLLETIRDRGATGQNERYRAMRCGESDPDRILSRLRELVAAAPTSSWGEAPLH